MFPAHTATSEGFTVMYRAAITTLIAIATVWTVSATLSGTTALAWLVLPLISAILFAPAIAGVLAARFWARSPRPLHERRTAFLMSTVACSGVYLVALFASILDATSAAVFVAASIICLVATAASAFAEPAK